MPYTHYLFDMPDMQTALEEINSSGDKIIGTFYLSDSAQVCLLIETRPDISSFKKLIGKDRKKDDAEVERA